MNMQAIWLKILSGKTLTEAEELAWHNRWCNDYPVRPVRPQPKKARDELIQALEALQDPKALCESRGHAADGHEYAYAAGVAKYYIEAALRTLGEPIDIHRPHGVPYHRAGSAHNQGDERG